MYEHKTRKLLLEDSNQFISDRLILGEVSRVLKFQEGLEYFLDLPIKQLALGYIKEVREDMSLSRLCAIMDKMDHPYVKYEDTVITPWDVCLALSSADLTGSFAMESLERKVCPHCGKDID